VEASTESEAKPSPKLIEEENNQSRKFDSVKRFTRRILEPEYMKMSNVGRVLKPEGSHDDRILEKARLQSERIEFAL
jgi:hypothetical protein